MTRSDLLTHDGITQPVTEWALDYGIPAKLILDRLVRGMCVARAITKPMPARPGATLDEDDCLPTPKRKRYAYKGQTLLAAEWARQLGIEPATLHARLRAGFSFYEAISPDFTGHKRGPNGGVGQNFPRRSRTGGGSIAQEHAQIEFSESPESSSP